MALTIDAPAVDHGVDLCPHCYRNRVVLLSSMLNHSDLNWFKCDGCDHIFTLPRLELANHEAA